MIGRGGGSKRRAEDTSRCRRRESQQQAKKALLLAEHSHARVLSINWLVRPRCMDARSGGTCHPSRLLDKEACG